MGKIRTKVLGSGEETKQKKKDQARREGKKLREKKEVLPEENLTADSSLTNQEEQTDAPLKKIKKKEIIVKEKGQKYKKVKTFVDKTKKYPLEEALKIVKKTSYTKFDGTVELHINTLEKGLRGTVTLPHGTGKTIKVAIASEELIKKVEAGTIDFDILVSTPQMMPKLAKLAKILGPKGLMPNPKAGTVTTEPEKMVEKFSHGQIQFKTEAEAPIIHAVIGKVSFSEEKLKANFVSFIEAVAKKNIRSVSLNCTMGPGIKISLE